MMRNILGAGIAAAAILVVGILLTRKTPVLYQACRIEETPEGAVPEIPKQPAGVAAVHRTVPETELQEWTERLRTRREIQIQNLKEYACAGLYPRNTDNPEGRAPVFVDDRDTTCAVGHLMCASGRRALVNSIRLTDNHVRVADIKEGAALDWILTSGFTQAECARIQPTYDYRRREARNADPRVVSHLLEVYHELVRDTPASLESALAALEKRLSEGPMGEECLRPVLSVALVHDAKLDPLIRK